MGTRYSALIFGIIYILVGIAGFVPPLLQPPSAAAPSISVTPFYGYLLGLFPVNIWLQAVGAIIAAYFGFFGPAETPTTRGVGA